MPGVAFIKYPKTCPVCGTQAHEIELVEAIFGWRVMNGTERPQSYCKECRSSKNKKTDAQAIRDLVAASPVTILGSIETASTGADLIAKKKKFFSDAEFVCFHPDCLKAKKKTKQHLKCNTCFDTFCGKHSKVNQHGVRQCWKHQPPKTLPPPTGTGLEISKEFIKRLNGKLSIKADDLLMQQIEDFLRDVSTEDLEDLINHFAANPSKRFNYGENQFTGFLDHELSLRKIQPEPLTRDELNDLYAKNYPGDKQVRSTKAKANRLAKKLAGDEKIVERLQAWLVG